VKASVCLPVIANGDIDSPRRARDVLLGTAADAIMIGRAAQGRPWIFREIAHYLATGDHLPAPTVEEARALILEHLDDHYAFYGEEAGVRIARKHLGWYTRDLVGAEGARAQFNAAESTAAQIAAVHRCFDRLAVVGERLVIAPAQPADGSVAPLRDEARQPAATPWGGEALAA
jgi:tRNA-dihydrouridine synthase B